MGGKIIPRIRLTSAKVVVEVEAELGYFKTIGICDPGLNGNLWKINSAS